MDSKEPKPQTETPEKVSLINKAAELAAYPFSIAAGGYAFYSHLEDKVFSSMKSLGYLGKELETFFDEEKEKGRKNLELGIKSGNADAANIASEIHSNFAPKLVARRKEIGIDGVIKGFDFISHRQQLGTIMSGLTAFGIALGVCLTVANHRSLIEEVNEHAKETENKEPQSRAL